MGETFCTEAEEFDKLFILSLKMPEFFYFFKEQMLRQINVLKLNCLHFRM